MKGTMVERSPGTWRLRVFVGNDPATGHPRQLSRTFNGGKRQASTELAKFVAAVEAGDAPVSGATTLGDLLDGWLEHITPLRQPGTIRGYQSHLTRIKPLLGPIRLSKLTAQDLDRAYRSWLGQGLSATTVHHHHAVLSAALRQAVRWGAISRAATEMASPPPLRVQTQAPTDPAVVRRLVAEADESHPILACTIALAAVTGCRREELCGLRWTDVDWDDGVLHVQRAVKHGLDHRAVVVGPTKSHQDRWVALDPFALAVLAQHRERMQAAATAARVGVLADGYILPGSRGRWSADPSGATPMKPDSIGQSFRRLTGRLGIGIRFHDLRHFCGTQLVAAVVDVRTVQAHLGHASWVTTNRYAHSLDDRKKAAAVVMGQLMTG
ncbi:MAG TPA: site-specific integrase [Acidimicrobiales bacterium]